MSAIDEALDYSKLDHMYGTYQLTRVVQQTGNQTNSISLQGGMESIFELPPKVWNLSKSYLQFQLNPVSSGTSPHFNWLHIDGVPAIRQIQLFTRSGLYVCDINDVDRYLKMVTRRKNLIGDVETWDHIGKGTVASGFFEGLQTCNVLATDSDRPDGVACDIHYLEPSYCISGTDSSAAPQINFKIYLDKFKNSILALNKDLYFGGEIIYLRIVWNSTSKVGWTGTVDTVPTTNVGPISAEIPITNLLLYLAIETNPIVENLIKTKVASGEGLSLLTPMVYYNKINLPSAAGINHTITTRYNRAHGLKLKKIFWSPFNGVETNNLAFDISNIAGIKVARFYTMVNNIRTSQYDYEAVNGDDWMVNRNLLRGSSILSSNEYYYNWVWEENFTDNNLAFKKVMELTDNFNEGLDLTNEIKYDVYATLGTLNPSTGNITSLTHYVYAVTEKLLTITASGVTFM